MDRKKLSKLGIYYALYPFKRNQDVVKVQKINSSLAISLADGFHHCQNDDASILLKI